LESINKNELKELLIKGWMTHDAMWFLHCLQKTGIELTNKINKAASKGLGLIEAKRFKKILGINKITKSDELKLFVKSIFDVVKAEFMNFSYEFLNGDELECKMHQCFAHDGVERIGVLDQYQCGIYERIEGWFQGLGLKYRASPQINGCLLYRGKKCTRRYTFKFPT